MINATGVYIQYGDRIVLDRINFTIKEKDKVGLVGKNGAGKSTLLKIISGENRPMEGNINKPPKATIGYLSQEMNLPKGKSVINEALAAFDEVKKVEDRIEAIQVELESRTDYESKAYYKILEELSDLTDRVQTLGGATREATAERVLAGLGFKHKDLNRLTDEFSGGWQMRIVLAKILLQNPDYILLDEPTNHLDIESIIWLENFLKQYEGAVILISHDRTFLDNVTNRTIEIELGKVYDYKAPYSKYLDLREERRSKLESAYANQQQKIADTERLIEKFRAKANKAKMAQSLIKQLDKIDRIELDSEDNSRLRFKFPPAPRSGEVVVNIKKLYKSYGNLDVLDEIDLQMLRGEKVAFVGKNGEGKSTLSKIIVGKEGHTGECTIGHNIHLAYYAQNQSDVLDPKMTVLETIEQVAPPEVRTKLRNILGSFLFSGEDVDKKVMVLSGGEKARLAMACLLLRPINLLVLDEPTNHLDMRSKEMLKEALKNYEGAMIVVSHDRDFLSGLTDRTIEFRDRKTRSYLGDINYFLEKREVDNFRSVSLGEGLESTSQQEEKKEVKQVDFKVLKKLQRSVQNSERRIETLEGELAKMETQIADPEEMAKASYQELIAKYNKKKEELEGQMAKWEDAQEELEKYENN